MLAESLRANGHSRKPYVGDEFHMDHMVERYIFTHEARDTITIPDTLPNLSVMFHFYNRQYKMKVMTLEKCGFYGRFWEAAEEHIRWRNDYYKNEKKFPTLEQWVKSSFNKDEWMPKVYLLNGKRGATQTNLSAFFDRKSRRHAMDRG